MFVSLKDRVVLITGAGSGIGRSAVYAFAQSGASVIVHCRSGAEDMEPLLAELNQYTGHHSVYPLDLRRSRDIPRMFAFIREKYGRLDVLINNAGYSPRDPFLEISDEKMEAAFAVNFFAPFVCAREAAHMMAENGGGKIIFVTSVDADRPGWNRAHYASAKAAEINLVKNMALELADYNILVNAVSPGAIDTKMTAEITAEESKLAHVLKGIPLRRFGKPEEIAAMLLFLASDYSAYTTGSVFTVDGGLSLKRGY